MTTTVLPHRDEPVDDAEQAVDVGRVEAGGRLRCCSASARRPA